MPDVLLDAIEEEEDEAKAAIDEGMMLRSTLHRTSVELSYVMSSIHDVWAGQHRPAAQVVAPEVPHAVSKSTKQSVCLRTSISHVNIKRTRWRTYSVQQNP